MLYKINYIAPHALMCDEMDGTDWRDDVSFVTILIFFSRLCFLYFQSFIKDEPEDAVSDIDYMDAVDPTQFLAVNDDPLPSIADDGPPILTSLGLTHINHVNEFFNLSTVCFAECVSFNTNEI